LRFSLTALAGGRSLERAFADGEAAELSLDELAAATAVTVMSDREAVTVATVSRRAWDEDLTLSVRVPLGEFAETLWPSYQGQFHSRAATGTPVSYEFRGPGWNAAGRDDQRLALPAVIVRTRAGYQLIGADPGFSAQVTLGGGADPYAEIGWTYRHEAGRHDITRRIVTRAAGTLEEAMDAWFELATPGVPKGPDWLHDIAWTNYDFMSKNGQGWYADIEAFCELIGPGERHRAAFTLHAWYDTVGRYCYDPVTRRLDESWTVFPHLGDPRLLAREGVQEPDGMHPPAYTFRNLARYRPLAMTWDDIRRRLEFAKDRGLRVPFYLTTGMMALGDRDEHIEAGDGLDSALGLWIGPDAAGDTYLMNPLHPDVRDRFLGLTSALLDRVGDLIDALVVDEAYYIGYGQLGPRACPGYADLAQATLLREMAARCHDRRPDIALLTADHLGTQYLEQQAFPYSLFADGIYHDAWCHAQSFAAGQFPTWRNVIWSCNWAPSSAIANTKWGVLAYGAPIATGNGCFGDDTGLAEMAPGQQELLARLWSTLTSRSARRRPEVTDILGPRQPVLVS
jgi:hypothetical protein